MAHKGTFPYAAVTFLLPLFFTGLVLDWVRERITGERRPIRKWLSIIVSIMLIPIVFFIVFSIAEDEVEDSGNPYVSAYMFLVGAALIILFCLCSICTVIGGKAVGMKSLQNLRSPFPKFSIPEARIKDVHKMREVQTSKGQEDAAKRRERSHVRKTDNQKRSQATVAKAEERRKRAEQKMQMAEEKQHCFWHEGYEQDICGAVCVSIEHVYPKQACTRQSMSRSTVPSTSTAASRISNPSRTPTVACW